MKERKIKKTDLLTMKIFLFFFQNKQLFIMKIEILPLLYTYAIDCGKNIINTPSTYIYMTLSTIFFISYYKILFYLSCVLIIIFY